MEGPDFDFCLVLRLVCCFAVDQKYTKSITTSLILPQCDKVENVLLIYDLQIMPMYIDCFLPLLVLFSVAPLD